jgi:endonuclease YncB( thermonuclease family)
MPARPPSAPLPARRRLLAATPASTPASTPVSLARRRLLASTLVALLPALAGHAGPAAAATARALPPSVEGIVLDVHDGDSFTFRGDNGRRLRIRVSGIDAPELHQPYADQSRRHLEEMLRGRRLRIDPIKQDVFDRTVAKVWVLDPDQPPTDAALSLVEAGLAWHFVRYRADQPPADVPRYAQAERAARARRAGLWQDAEAEAPWDFRSRARRNEAAPPRRPRIDTEG